MPTRRPLSSEAQARKNAADRARRAQALTGAYRTPECGSCGWYRFAPTELGARIAIGLHRRREHGIFGPTITTPAPPDTLARFHKRAGENFDSTGLLDLLSLGKRRAA